MNTTKTYNGDCVIVPVHGQAVISTTAVPPLRLPGERLPRRQSWRVFVVVALSFSLWLHPTPTNASVAPSDVLRLTNLERSAAGLSALTADSELTAAATAKANDMFAQQYFSHVSPSGVRGWHWMKQAGYPYTEAGENLAMDFVDSQDVVAAWMGSAGHRQNMVSEKYVDAGIAIVPGVLNGKKAMIIVMLFGRQSSVTAVALTTPLPSTVTTVKEPVAPIPNPVVAPAPLPKPVAPAPQAIAPLIPSIAEPVGLATPTLTFTLLDPDPAYLRPVRPQILGVSTALNAQPTSAENSGPIASIILTGLFLAAGTIGLASRWWGSVYPQGQFRPVRATA